MKDVTANKMYYYVHNGHGDVVQIINEAGAVVNQYQYDEWGNITSQSETVFNEFKYAGEIYDTESGLYYLRARYYDPSVGRFISKDSYEGSVGNPLTLNAFTYCHNSPLMGVDPSGHKARTHVYNFGKDEVIQSYNNETVYHVMPSDHDYDFWDTFFGWIPGLNLSYPLGETFDECMNGTKDVDTNSAKSLISDLEKIKDNNGNQISLGVLSQLDSLRSFINLGRYKPAAKVAGKAASAIGTVFSLWDTVKYFTDEDYVSEQIACKAFFNQMWSTSRVGVEKKFLYAFGVTKMLITQGKISYTLDSNGNVLNYAFKSWNKDGVPVMQTLKQLDTMNGESGLFIEEHYTIYGY